MVENANSLADLAVCKWHLVHEDVKDLSVMVAFLVEAEPQ